MLKKKEPKRNKKEDKFKQILLLLLIQFAECNANEALLFIEDLLDKMEKYKLKIK